MSVGDIVSDVQIIAGGASLTFQPVVGVEALIFGATSSLWIGVYPNGAPDANFNYREGAIATRITNVNQNPTFWQDLKVYISNTVYFYIFNSSVAVANISYWGIQIK